MKDRDKTKQQLIAEREELRQRVEQLEASQRAPRDDGDRCGPTNPLWRSLVDGTPLFVLVLDRDCRILFLNHTDSGAAASQLVGKDLCDFCRPEDRAGVRDCIQRVFQTGQPCVSEGPGLRLDNEEHWYASHFGPIVEDSRVVAVSLVSVNATERKRAEAALRLVHDELEARVAVRTADLQTSNAELEAIYDGMVDGLLLVDVETKRLLRANPAFCRMFGYTQAELPSLTVEDIRPRELLPETLTRFKAHTAHSGTHSDDIQFVRKDRTRFLADVRSNHILHNGRPALVAFLHDITDRKQAEEALRQSRDELRTIYEGTVDGILIADCATGRFLLANPAICQMLGYSETQLLSMSVMDIHPPEAAKAVLEKFRTQVAGPRLITRDRIVIRGDDSVLYADIANTRIDYQGRSCVIGFFRDVTDRKLAEAALQRSHDELQAIYDGMADGLNILDIEDRKAVRVNSAICRMLGYTEEEALALTFAEAHPAEHQAWLRERLNANCEKLHALEENVPLVRKDGSVFYADISSSRILYNDRPCMLNFFRDVTERRQAQEALERERRTLEHMLRASDHERQVIAYDIHDGLAQQLTGAILQFQIYEHFRGAKPLDAAEAYNAGMTMLKQSHFEARRLISGVRPPVLDEAGVIEAIAHLVHEQRRGVNAKIGVHSKVDFDRLPPVLENAIYRIVQEALANACNHSKSERIRIVLLQRGELLRIEVRDWGIGFSPKEVGENRFGLQGIRERARLLGGKSRIQSKAGKGTRITVALPLLPRKNNV